MRTVRLFLHARAVVKFVLRAASSEHFFSFIKGKRCFAPSNLADTSKPALTGAELGNKRSYRSLTILVSLQPVCLV